MSLYKSCGHRAVQVEQPMFLWTKPKVNNLRAYSKQAKTPLSVTVPRTNDRGPTTTSCCATGRRSSCAPCRARHRLTKASSATSTTSTCRVHVPVIIRGRRRSGGTRARATSAPAPGSARSSASWTPSASPRPALAASQQWSGPGASFRCPAGP